MSMCASRSNLVVDKPDRRKEPHLCYRTYLWSQQYLPLPNELFEQRRAMRHRTLQLYNGQCESSSITAALGCLAADRGLSRQTNASQSSPVLVLSTPVDSGKLFRRTLSAGLFRVHRNPELIKSGARSAAKEATFSWRAAAAAAACIIEYPMLFIHGRRRDFNDFQSDGEGLG
jgi:hypothetical protein